MNELAPRHTSGLIFVCGCGWTGNVNSAAIHTVKMHGMYPTDSTDRIECSDCTNGQRPNLGSPFAGGCAMLPMYIS